jgi:rare lipoprotein A
MAAAAIGLSVANCGFRPGASSSFDPKYGVSASPRVVAEGEAVPKGGGRALVGRPYVIAGKIYVPQDSHGYVREGLASWYGSAFHGRLTANGEIFDRYSIAAAHPTLPLPSYARVTNLRNSRSMVVRVNDRGPYHGNRIIDLSERAAEALDFKRAGTAPVRVEYLRKASLNGSDDEKLLATLREDGRPATFPGMSPVMVADRGGQRPQALAFSPERRDAFAYGEAPAVAPEPPRRPGPFLMANAFRGTPGRSSLDLATIPGADTPLRAIPVAEASPARSAHASLFFADPHPPRSGFVKDDPFSNLKPQRFVALKGHRRVP